VVEGVGVLLAEIALDTANGQIHLGKPPGGVIRLLTVDADVADLAAMLFDELFRLYEHAAGTAARIVYSALVGSQHFDQHPDDTAGRVELAALLALGAGELREEILIDPAEDVLGSVFPVAQANVANKVDELAEPLLVEARVSIVLGKHAFERRVIALNGEHGVVNGLADPRVFSLSPEILPA
jgi:hypothetical protein